MWRFDLEGMRWERIEQLGKVPGPRCGHSFNLHNDKIFLFGGLREVTQETNETLRFDIQTSTWEEIGRCSSNISFDTITPVTSTRILQTHDKMKENSNSSFATLVKKESMMDTIPHASSSDMASPTINPLKTVPSKSSLAAARVSGTPSAMLKDMSSFS